MSFKYMSTSITAASEVFVVAVGPIACLLLFAGMVIAAIAFYRYAAFFPDSASLFVAAFGVATALDPYLVLIVDLLARNYSCSRQSEACRENYTSIHCKCFNGDFVKLWYRMNADEGSGVSGLFIYIMMNIAVSVVALLALHEYLVYVHKDS
eukprot:gene851-950_t